MQADLVYFDGDRAVLVVEAKGRKVTDEFRSAIDAQVRSLLDATGAAWMLLVDTDEALLYDASHSDSPVAAIPTTTLMERAGLADEARLGEALILLATERWVDALRTTGVSEGGGSPEMARMITDLQSADRSELDYRVA